jgi:hypothetical protein
MKLMNYAVFRKHMIMTGERKTISNKYEKTKKKEKIKQKEINGISYS